MARILAISSHVAYGSVGLASIVPALQWLGHETMPVPTVVLSCNPAYPHFAGRAVPADEIVAILAALDANGWLAETAAVLSGYLPSRAHVAAVRGAVERVRAANPAALFLCDPVFGDEPEGLYLSAEVADAIRDQLLPLADITTPNSFELSYLSGRPASNPREARAAAAALPVSTVLGTSIPADGNRLANVLVSGDEALVCHVARRAEAPHGTGDMLAAMFLGHRLNGASNNHALGAAAGGVDASVTAAHGLEELPLASADSVWRSAEILPTAPIF